MKARWVALIGMAVALAGCSKTPAVEDAWVRLPAVPGRPAAAYATIDPGTFTIVLTGIASPAARRIELHRSMVGDHGAMTMRPVERLPISTDRVTLAPGGLHAMLFDLKGDLRPGGTIPLTFRFDDRREITVEARLVGAGDPAP